MPERGAGSNWRWLFILLAIGLLAALLLWDPAAPRAPLAREVLTSTPPAAPVVSPPIPAANSSDAGFAESAAHCVRHASRACHEGAAWWFDSCGTPEDLAEDCAGRSCRDGACAPDDSAANRCGTLSAFGSCDGDVAKACLSNTIVSVDCAQKGQRCVMTGEGAACLPRDEKFGCKNDDIAGCRAERLRQCVDGRWREIDCAARKATCQNSGASAHCEALDIATVTPKPLEICDGRDNDDDGQIDEGGVCDPVALVAFVPAGAKLIALAARMEQELAILNRVYAPRSFRWVRTREVSASYRNFSPKQLESAATLLAQLESKNYLARNPPASSTAADGGGLDFYIPVLYTEKLSLEPPKGGLSTLPNARCGGVRVSDLPSPVAGLIVLPEVRQPETLAHELGHYLGLCHTHEELARFAVATESAQSCQTSGDGICDTADDPGPTECWLYDGCDLACRRPARPDATNIMSYYLGCRRILSSEQLAETERNLSLRRDWFRCLDARDCPCDPRATDSCPSEMSCHLGASGDTSWACELDGASLPGTSCRDTSQCSQHSFCLGPAGDKTAARCARPCIHDDPSCTCRDVGLAFSVCAQDLPSG
jgi:hypothetical protein